MTVSGLVSNLGKDVWRKLIAVSGGVDSQYVLHQQLSETDDEIYIFHVRIHRVSTEGRYDYEFQAFERCMEWHEKNNRPIAGAYIYDFEPPFIPPERSLQCLVSNQWTPKLRGFPGIVLDHDVVALYGGLITRQIWADKFLVGRNLSEDSTVKGRMCAQDANVLFAAATRSMPVEYVTPIRHYSKKEIFDLCPKELAALTIKCRQPTRISETEWEECNECMACLRNNEAQFVGGPTLNTQELLRRHQCGNLFVTKDGRF